MDSTDMSIMLEMLQETQERRIWDKTERLGVC